MKQSPIRNILVPIDFSKISIEAIATAKQLATQFGAAIHLVHTYQLDHLAGFIGSTGPAMLWPVAFYEQAGKELAHRLVKVARKHGLPVAGTCHVRSGTPAFDEICLLAKEIPADLIVIPTHGYRGLKHVLLGSTAERVVQHSPCPVFVRRKASRTAPGPKSPEKFKKILVPIDFSASSLEALNYAIGFARRFSARLVLLHSVYFPYSYRGDGQEMYDISAFLEAARKNAHEQFRTFVKAAQFGPVPFETVVAVGPPVDEVCANAERDRADLIITATHGWTGFKHVLIGSVAEHVVRHAPCPVLVVPSHPEVRREQLIRPVARKQVSSLSPSRRLPPGSIKGRRVTKRYRKTVTRPFPERRRTNKFRESHERQ